MTKPILVFALCALLCGSALAQTAARPEFTRALEIINQSNAANPATSPRHERSREVLTDRVLDSKNHVIGQVRDITLSPSGNIAQISTELKGSNILALDYEQMDVEPVGNGYKLQYAQEQITDMVPELLAGMATAAGAEDIFSLRNLIGAPVKSDDGRTLGQVSDVVFDDLGGRAEFLYVQMGYQNVKRRALAVPFNMATYKAGFGSHIDVSVDDALADAMISYAKIR
jgi:sporulation protein YlmC with PRC-barrel domain